MTAEIVSIKKHLKILQSDVNCLQMALSKERFLFCFENTSVTQPTEPRLPFSEFSFYGPTFREGLFESCNCKVFCFGRFWLKPISFLTSAQTQPGAGESLVRGCRCQLFKPVDVFLGQSEEVTIVEGNIINGDHKLIHNTCMYIVYHKVE